MTSHELCSSQLWVLDYVHNSIHNPTGQTRILEGHEEVFLFPSPTRLPEDTNAYQHQDRPWLVNWIPYVHTPTSAEDHGSPQMFLASHMGKQTPEETTAQDQATQSISWYV